MILQGHGGGDVALKKLLSVVCRAAAIMVLISERVLHCTCTQVIIMPVARWIVLSGPRSHIDCQGCSSGSSRKMLTVLSKGRVLYCIYHHSCLDVAVSMHLLAIMFQSTHSLSSVQGTSGSIQAQITLVRKRVLYCIHHYCSF